MPRRFFLLLATAFAAVCAPARADVPLHRCGSALCGHVARPLDPSRPHGRSLAIGFKLWRAKHPDGPAIVATEGGPGYPSTGSEVEYRGIYAPLLRTRTLLLVDNRGTGTSGLIDCRRLQAFTGRTSGWAFARRVRQCADTIEGRDFYATSYSADDLAAVIRALKLGKVDLYGDSYGTYFSQYFMALHPELLHSVVLDSAYSARALDPWYASSGTAARGALEKVAPGSVDRLAQLLASGRSHARLLADMVQDFGSDPVILRELDASVRAALAGDGVPLQRLMTQSRAWDHGTSAADYFSDGLYMAVSCNDYPQLFSLGATPARRRAQLAAAQAPDAFRPFTPAQWLTISGYSQPYDVCLDWPAPRTRPPALPDRPLPASVPVLIVGGDLDDLTPFADAKAFGPALGANVRVVELPNTVHVTSEGDTYLARGADCGRRIIRSFTRGALDTRCAAHIPPLRTPVYPRTLAGAPLAAVVSGADPGERARRAVTVAVNALADAAVHGFYSDDRRGLRGGRFSVHGTRLELTRVRYTTDTRASGSGTYDIATGRVEGKVSVAGTSVSVRWTPGMDQAIAKIRGAVLAVPSPL